MLSSNTRHCTGSTIALTKGFLSPSLSTQLIVRLILWSADVGSNHVLLTLGISIALAIHSLDPLDRGKGLRLERGAC